MAGAGYKLFNTGDVLTAAQVNTYLQEQAVMRFANSTARTTALSGVLAEGMVSYLDDTNAVEVYNGSAWVGVGSSGDITGVTAGTGISGGGTSGDVTITNSMATAIDAKGDLIVGTGADTFARLAVGGTNGHTLQVDSSTATGLKWAAAAGGGGAMVLLAAESFTTSSAYTKDSIFTSTYRNYFIELDITSAVTAVDVYWRMRASGSDNTTANYALTVNAVVNTTGAAANQYNNGVNEWGAGLGCNSNGCRAQIFLNTPQVAERTQANALNAHGAFHTQNSAYTFAATTQFDGIKFYPNAGTITGTVRIYGLVDA